MSQRVNCHKDFDFQVDVTIPNTAGVLATPAAGVITALKMRLAATRNGTAIHADVDALSASERAGQAARFYVSVDKAKLETHILTLGVGAPFFAVWSKTGDMDMENVRYLVDDGTNVA